MSNETLILKTAVATNSTLKLTDCPMSSGEILEMVCRLYANGLTSGNRCFKAIGNAVTYNTDAVTEGDIYCVSYRDGGFYVGLRTTEDYEPKEGDWWCIYSEPNVNYTNSSKVSQKLYRTEIIKLLACLAIDNTSKKVYYPKSNAFYFTTANIQAVTINRYTGNRLTGVPAQQSSILVDGLLSKLGTECYNQNNLPSEAIGEDFTGIFLKQLTNSDITAYNATGHIGWLILSDATLAFTKTGPYSSNRTAAYSENTVDINAIYVLEVRINGQRAHITAAALNYVYSDIGQKGNAPYELVDGLLIFNQTAKQYSDVNDYNVDNLLKGFYALTTLETASDTDTVTVYKYEVYQDNRPVALNQLNTNVQDEG